MYKSKYFHAKSIVFLAFLLSFAACKHKHGDTNTEATETAEVEKPSVSAPKPAVISLEKPAFAFFLESSGSMFAYNGTTSSLRRVIYELLTRLPDASAPRHSLAYITDKVYPTNMAFQDFMSNPDPFAAARQMGVKTTSSELNTMLQSVAQTAAQGKVAVLISDCVYSLRNGKAIANLDGLKYTTKENFQPKITNLEVLVLQMEGNYNGTYYDNTNKSSRLVGMRPYYIIVMAPKKQMATLLHASDYQSWQDFRSLAGFRNYAHFTTTNAATAPYYSVLPSTRKTGNFAIDRAASTAKCVKGISGCDLRRSGRVAFAVGIDLSSVFADDAFKQNPENYTIKASDNFKIEQIVPIEQANIAANDRTYLGSATHVVTLSTTQISSAKQSAVLQLQAKLPDWVAQSNTNDDSNTASDKSLQAKTFGLKPLLEGLHEAYHPTGGSLAFFSVPISIAK